MSVGLRGRFSIGFLWIFLNLCPLHAKGDENSDLNLIPNTIRTHEKENLFQNDLKKELKDNSIQEHFKLNGRFHIEDTFTHWWNRGDLLVPVPVALPSSQNRTSFDSNYEWRPLPPLSFHLSDRLNFFEENDISFPSRGNARNDFREGYASFEFLPKIYLEAGRINIRNGAALGFNPTDFFKTRTLVSQASIDPSTLRQNRLGTVMIQGQNIWDRGSTRIAFAPALQTASPLTTTPPPSLDMLIGRTNAVERFLFTLNYEIADLSPQILLYHDNLGTKFGLNLSQVFGSSFIGYLEWSGGVQAKLSDRAITFGQNTGTLPLNIPILPQTDTGTSFQSDLTVGTSWASSFKMTLNLEYHFHQSGFTQQDFSNWMILGITHPQLQTLLWYIRQYAADQQEPLMQQEIFIRMDYPDFGFRNLNLGTVTFVNPYDGSVYGQLSTTYFLSRAWTLGAYLSAALGDSGTEKGSLPQSTIGALQVVFYP